MAGKDLTLFLKVKDLASSTFNQFKSNVTKGSNQVASQWLNVGNIIAGAFSVAAIKRFIDASNKQEEAVNNLNRALRNSGETYEGASSELQAYASSLQKVTKFGDEAILQAQSMLISMTGTTNGIKPVTRAMLDLAEVHGKTAEEMARLIGQAINGQESLATYGISLKGIEGAGNRAAKIVELVGEKMGGAAEAGAKTFQGRAEQIANAWGDTEEIIGQFAKTLLADLMPAIEVVIPLLGKGFTTVVEGIKIAFAGIFTAIAGIGAGVEALLNMLGISNSKFFAQLTEAGVGLITEYAGNIADTWATTEQAVTDYGETIKREIPKATPTLAEHYAVLGRVIRQWDTLAQKAIPEAPKAIAKVDEAWIESKKVSLDAVTLMQAEIYELSGFLSNQFAGVVSAMSNSINMAFSGARGAGKEFLKAILLQFIDTVQGMIVAAKAAAIAKGILTFGISVGPDLAALLGATAILQTARYFVAKMHKGGTAFIDAPSQAEVPLLVRGQETVRVTTPEQEARGSSPNVSITINNYSDITAEEGIKKAVEAGLRATGLTITEYFSNSRNNLALAL